MLGALISVATGCKDEDKIRIPEVQTGANLRLVLTPGHDNIQSTEVATDYIEFTAYSQNTDLSSVEIYIHYKNQRHLFATYSQADFNDGSVTGQFDGADLAGWFGVPGFGDGSRGGNFTLRPRVTLNDGRVYPGWVHLTDTDSISNLGTGITGNNNSGAFTISRGTAILCPPVDISGNWLVVSSEGTSTDPGVDPQFRSISGAVIAITPVSGNPQLFNVSDVTGGIYFDWYATVYPDDVTSPAASAGKFMFNCNEINIVQTTELFGASVTGEGLYDAGAQTLTYFYQNGWGDYAEIVLQKQ